MTLVTNVKGEQVELADDFGVQAQQAAEEHLAACWSHFRAEEFDDIPEDAVSPAVGAFDGCQTCEIREVLYASIPFLQAGFARDGEAPLEAYSINLISCPIEDAIEGTDLIAEERTDG
jgi:hypothetical protein